MKYLLLLLVSVYCFNTSAQDVVLTPAVWKYTNRESGVQIYKSSTLSAHVRVCYESNSSKDTTLSLILYSSGAGEYTVLAPKKWTHS